MINRSGGGGTPLKAPCIGVCSTSLGDSVCRGCKRFAHEIIAWNSYSEQERGLVVVRLEQLLASVVAARIELFDIARLFQSARILGCQPDGSNPYCHIQRLLRVAASRIEQPEDYGFRVRPAFASQSLVQLRDNVERAFLELSAAHYERYLAPGIVAETPAASR